MPKIIGPPTVRFLLFDSDAKEETYIICFFTIRKGVRLKIGSGLKIHPENWDFETQRARAGKRFDASKRGDTNRRLEQIREHCEDIYKQYGKQVGLTFFKAQLKKRMERDETGGDYSEHPHTLLTYARHYCSEVKPKQNVRESTLKNYSKTLTHLEGYAKDRRTNLEFSEIGKAFFFDFVGWLYAPPRNHSINSAARMVRWVKEIVKSAERELKLTLPIDYADFRVKAAKTSHIIFTFEELAVFENLDLSDNQRLDRTRDLLLIGCHTGLRFSDFTRITPGHIITQQGVRLIQLTAGKTDGTVVIPLHPTLDKVLSKYGYHAPKISNQKLNLFLKELAKLAGFTNEIVLKEATGGRVRERTVQKWEVVSTHTCRRSFASNYYHKYPEMINEIRAITGHTTERQFRAYIIADQIEGAVRFAKAIS